MQADVTLRALAESKGLLVGVAVNEGRLADPAYAQAVATHFNSITAQNSMKWDTVWALPPLMNGTADQWSLRPSYGPGDEVVSFASRNGMTVRGHTMLWGQSFFIDSQHLAWLRNISSDADFKTIVGRMIASDAAHYCGTAVTRYDVVNEAFEYSQAGIFTPTDPFRLRIGPDYIDWALRTAKQACPSIKMFWNETNTEYSKANLAALIREVTRMRAAGVPIDGVGLQTHLMMGDVSPEELLAGVRALRATGVEVAITEMDVPMGSHQWSSSLVRSDARQAQIYGQEVAALLAGGGNEITVWGLNDSDTWLDTPWSVHGWTKPTKALLLDSSNVPKAAYRSVYEAMSAAPTSSTPTTGVVTTTTETDTTATATSGSKSTAITSTNSIVCAATPYGWQGYTGMSANHPRLSTGVLIPPAAPGRFLRVRSATISSYDYVSAPLRSQTNESAEVVGLAIGTTTGSDMTQDLPDTLAEGAESDAYSGLRVTTLPGWSGKAILGGEIVITHGSLGGTAGENGLSIREVQIMVESCPVATTTATTTTPVTTTPVTTTPTTTPTTSTPTTTPATSTPTTTPATSTPTTTPATSTPTTTPEAPPTTPTPVSAPTTSPATANPITDQPTAQGRVDSSRFVTLTSSRLADTRRSSPAYGGFFVVDTKRIHVQVAGRGGVPFDATAAVLNITAVDASPGYVSVFPSGSDPVASTLNVDRPRATIANLATVQLGPDGGVEIFVEGTASIVVDVAGAYVPASTSRGGRFLPIASQRLVDTRTEAAPSRPGSTNRVSLTALGLPHDATAVVVTLTAIGAAPGYWSVMPSGAGPTLTSNLNIDRAGSTRANQAVVSIAAGQTALDVFTSGGGHWTLDVTGYYTGASAPKSRHGLFVAMTPTRQLDTRATGKRVAPLGTSHVPWTVEASAVVVNLTAVDTSGAGHFTLYPAGSARPEVSNLNATAAGETVADHAIVAPSAYGFSVFSAGGGDIIVDISGYFL